MANTALRRGSQDEGNSDYFTGCPIGGGFMWFGLPDKIPTNCMICDNSTLAISSFAKLYENLGGAWGVSGGSMNIPDLRGKFPRGVDGGATNDPDAAGRTNPNAGGNTGDAVGSVQDGAFQGHAHGASESVQLSASSTATPRGIQLWTANTYTNTSLLTNAEKDDLQSSGFGTPKQGNETRPTNANVYFVIRVS